MNPTATLGPVTAIWLQQQAFHRYKEVGQKPPESLFCESWKQKINKTLNSQNLAKLEPQTQLFPIKTGERFHIDHEFNAQTPVYDSKVPTGFFGVSAEIPVTFILYATIGVPRLIHARSVGPLDIGRVVGIDTMFVGGRAKAVLSLKTNVREGDYVTNLKQYDPSAIEFEFHIPKGQNVQEIFA